MRLKIKDRKMVHVYMEHELQSKVVDKAIDLGLSTSAYLRMLILKDLNDKH